MRKRETGPKGETLLWSGHLRCLHCGGALGRHRISSRGYTYLYYRCWRAENTPPTPSCENGRRWPVVATDAAWWQLLVDTLADPARWPELLPPVAAPASSPPPAQVGELEDAIARAWEPYAAGKVSLEMAERLAAPYVAELARLREEYAPAPAAPARDFTALSAELHAAALKAGTTEERRELLALLNVRLYIGLEGVERVSAQVV